MKTKRRPLGRPVSTRVEYRRIAALLRARIRSGAWPRGMTLPSFKSLARRFRTGEITIRRSLEVLRSEGLAGPTPRRRWAVREPPRAATLVRGIILEIASDFLKDILLQPHLSELQRGILMGAGELKSPLFVVHNRHLKRELPDELLDLPLRGIVLLGSFSRKVARRLERLRLPVVLLDRPDPHWKLHTASVDNVAAVCEATARLIALGHRRIAFVRYLDLFSRGIDPDSAERERGFFLAFEQAGLRKPKHCLFNALGSLESPESPWVRSILTRSPPFTAVVTVDPGRAQVLWQGASARGIPVPQALSIVCFQPHLIARPRFAGPRVDFFELGRRAMALLDRPIQPAIHWHVSASWTGGDTLAVPPVHGNRE